MQDLRRQLRTDRSPGACHQHAFPFEELTDRIARQFDPLAAHEILDIDRPQLRHVDLAADEVIDPGNRLECQVRFGYASDDLSKTAT